MDKPKRSKMMQSKPKTMSEKIDEVVQIKERSFFFPHFGVSITAKDKEEATEKLIKSKKINK